MEARMHYKLTSAVLLVMPKHTERVKIASMFTLRRRLFCLCLFTCLIAPHPVYANHTPPPTTVTIPGTLQSEAGCPGDWQPDCQATFLVYDAEDDVWQGEFLVQPENDQDQLGPRYKAALNQGWGENYGLNAQGGGADIPLAVTQPTRIKFYYDHKTHWVVDNFNTSIIVAVGDFQGQLGCQQNNDPSCLRSWLQDPAGSGIYSLVTPALAPGSYQVSIAMNEQPNATPSTPISFTVGQDKAEVYLGYEAASGKLTVSTDGAPRGSLAKAQAHWLTRDTLVWNGVGGKTNRYFLHYAPSGGLQLGPRGVEGGEQFTLMFEPKGPGIELQKKYPHLLGFATLKLNADDLKRVPEFLTGQVAVSAWDENGKMLDATGVQISGVLDDLYTFTGALGVTYMDDKPTLRLWAPTAKSVTLRLYASSTVTLALARPLTRDPATGVWSITGQPDWTDKFYLYEVEVYVPATGKMEKNIVTDPYSFSLAPNSTRSQIVNLNDARLKPSGWDNLRKPELVAPEDAVLYELHVRDFSIFDGTVPELERGTFKAFTELNSNGMRHLKALADAGLTHIHLLPAFDIATVNENKAERREPNLAALAALPPDSAEQQRLVSLTAGEDGFNWGYDPYHYTVPEGSYSTNPDGVTRILEFREMVQALNQTGLRVVMDVVYNHTHSSGQDAQSVLDRIVPGYYHRLDGDGKVTNSTCCANTASEHAMMEKLLIDSVLTWATAYKVDGFRFDLMGHHMLSNMTNLRQALDALTPATTGVDGRAIYVYGEGWNFGEVADNARGRNATQRNIARTGIGVFNDRLRDAARGGGPFSGLQEQGFVTGLTDDPNETETRSAEDRAGLARRYGDWIKVSLAGALKEYPLTNALGVPAEGAAIDYKGSPAGYTADPQENILYVSAHDNETLFDVIQLKAPATATLAERVRMNNLALSLVMFGQGVPFFHAGDDLLRSKSLDRNSYNSGDWFNRLDFTYTTNNFGVGLPPAENQSNWGVMQPLLANAALKPSATEIKRAAQNFRELLQIRQSSRLFRLRTAEEVKAHLRFFNSGQDQIPGLIFMMLDNTDGKLADPYEMMVVLFNGNKETVTFETDNLRGYNLTLHPIQLAGGDPVVKQTSFDQNSGAFSVPGRTTAVFVALATLPTTTPKPTATTAAPQAPASTPAPIQTPAPVTPSPATSSNRLVVALMAVITFILGLVWRGQRRGRG